MSRSAEEISQSIAELEARERELKQELKTLEGRVRNRDPRQLEKLRFDHRAAHQKWEALEKRVDQLLGENTLPHRAEDAILDVELLREATMVYCQQINLDPEAWKHLNTPNPG